MDGSKRQRIVDLQPEALEGLVVYHPSTTHVLDSVGKHISGHVLDQGQEEKEASTENDGFLKRWNCSACGLRFESGTEQRSHFKADFHRLNVKRKLLKKKALSEEEFEAFAEGHERDSDISSISGSETESEDDEEKLETNFASPFKHQGRKSVLFRLNSGQIISVWQCVLSDKDGCKDVGTKEESKVSDTVLLSRLTGLVGSSATWVVLLAVGGHFAGIVMNLKGSGVIAHKTFHRYVVRARAGGRQTTKDATGRAPKSAGASLRRYNEYALQKDIQLLLSSWTQHLQNADKIFVHVPSRNAQTFFGGKSPPLDKGDPRVLQIPFTIKRPTFKEAKRVFEMLVSFAFVEKESKIVSGELVTKAEEQEKTKMHFDGSRSDIVQAPVVDVEQHTEEGHKGEEKSSTKVDLTPLHEASKVGNIEHVLELLEQGADPCAKDVAGRTPYIVAANKETRNAFRKFMACHPDQWDWNAANVPSALTEEMEAAQAAKQAEKNAKWKAKEKERRKQRKAQEKNKAKDNLSSIPALDPQEELRKKQLEERDLRAAAAENRLKAMLSSGSKNGSLHVEQPPASSKGAVSISKDDANVCSCCGVSLTQKVPFYRLSYRYCSTTCVHVHRKMLERD